MSFPKYLLIHLCYGFHVYVGLFIKLSLGRHKKFSNFSKGVFTRFLGRGIGLIFFCFLYLRCNYFIDLNIIDISRYAANKADIATYRQKIATIRAMISNILNMIGHQPNLFSKDNPCINNQKYYVCILLLICKSHAKSAS
jgi:hypothetical protein